MIYNSNGGVTYGDVQKMPRKKFLWFLERLSKQKKEENDAMKKNKLPTKGTTKMKKYLGKL